MLGIKDIKNDSRSELVSNNSDVKLLTTDFNGVLHSAMLVVKPAKESAKDIVTLKYKNARIRIFVTNDDELGAVQCIFG